MFSFCNISFNDESVEQIFEIICIIFKLGLAVDDVDKSTSAFRDEHVQLLTYAGNQRNRSFPRNLEWMPDLMETFIVYWTPAPVRPGAVNMQFVNVLVWLQASPVRALLANFSHPVSSGEHGGNGCRGPAGRTAGS